MDIPKTIWLQTGETTLLRCRDTENEVTYIDLVRLAAKAAGRTEEISDEVADFRRRGFTRSVRATPASRLHWSYLNETLPITWIGSRAMLKAERYESS